MTVNLAKYKAENSNVFTGRPQGEAVRRELKLNLVDKTDEIVEFVIPTETTSITPSFYLGLLFESIKAVGADKFPKKYKFSFETTNELLIENLKKNLDDGWRNAQNSLNNNFGFDIFLKQSAV